MAKPDHEPRRLRTRPTLRETLVYPLAAVAIAVSGKIIYDQYSPKTQVIEIPPQLQQSGKDIVYIDQKARKLGETDPKESLLWEEVNIAWNLLKTANPQIKNAAIVPLIEKVLGNSSNEAIQTAQKIRLANNINFELSENTNSLLTSFNTRATLQQPIERTIVISPSRLSQEDDLEKALLESVRRIMQQDFVKKIGDTTGLPPHQQVEYEIQQLTNPEIRKRMFEYANGQEYEALLQQRRLTGSFKKLPIITPPIAEYLRDTAMYIECKEDQSGTCWRQYADKKFQPQPIPRPLPTSTQR